MVAAFVDVSAKIGSEKMLWYGSHHHYQTGYTPLYVTEQCYKYNYRDANIFGKFLRECV